jgi:hypothetical protein
MKKFVLSGFVALMLTNPTLSYAQSNQPPDQLMENGVKMILDAMKIFIQNLPQYAAPEVLDNGDIIIRRKRPENEKSNEKSKTQTRT